MRMNELWLRVLVRSQSSSHLKRLRADRGASAVEYGLLIAGIAAVIALVVYAFGSTITDVFFEETCQELVAGSGKGDCV
jgi:pilus assembly protein Flp/PilA